MFKKIILSILGLALLASAAAAVAPDPVRGTLPFYWVEGQVTDNGTAAVGRTVYFYKNSKDLLAGDYVTTETVAGGAYRLNAFELQYYHDLTLAFPGNYKIAVSIEAAFTTGTEESITIISAQGFVAKDLILIVGGGPNLATGSIQGTLESYLGGFVDPDTKVIIWIDGVSYEATVGADGTFSVSGIPAGTYVITITWDSQSVSKYDVVVKDGETTPIGTLKGILGGSIIGKLYDQKADPVFNDNLTLTFDEQTPITGVKTDAKGNFAVDGVSGGTGTVTISLNNLQAKSGSITVAEGKVTDVGSLTLLPNIAPGTVYLEISRLNTDSDPKEDAIKINWSSSLYPSPEIFVRLGDGSGQYTNDLIDKANGSLNWVPIIGFKADKSWGLLPSGSWPPALKDNLELKDPSTNNPYLILKGQVGGGLPEVYYKGVQKDVVIFDTSPQGVITVNPLGQTTLEAAPAVGKFDVTVGPATTSPDLFFISTPLFQTDTSPQAVFGSQLENHEWVAEFSNDIKVSKGTYNMDGNLITYTGAPQPLSKINVGQGFAFNTQISKNITFVGEVLSQDFSTILMSGPQSQPCWLGNPYPKALSMAVAGLKASSFNNAHIDQCARLKQFNASVIVINKNYGSAYHNDENSWLTENQLENATLSLQPGKGYYFWDPVKTKVDWTITKPYQ